MTCENLTRHHIAILNLLVEGCTDKEIASRVGLAVSSIKNRLSEMYKIMGVKNRVQAAVLYDRTRRIEKVKDDELSQV